MIINQSAIKLNSSTNTFNQQYPTCDTHKSKMKYVCTYEDCKNHELSCGDCLYEKHQHPNNIILSMKNCKKQYKLLDQQSMQKEIPLCINSLQNLTEINIQLEIMKKQYINNLKAIQQKIKKQFQFNIEYLKQFSLQGQQEFNEFFLNLENKSNEDIQLKLNIYEKLNKNLDYLLNYKGKNSVFQRNNIEKQKQNIINNLKNLQIQVDELFEKNQKDSLEQFLNYDLINREVKQWNYTFDTQSAMKFKDKWAENDDENSQFFRFVSLQSLPPENVYWEIIKVNNGGCYSSIGVSNIKNVLNANAIFTKNGSDCNGWTIKTINDQDGQCINLAYHNNVARKVNISFEDNVKIGLFYNHTQKTLSYFADGFFVSTPFTNVNVDNQKLYFVIEVCQCDNQQYQIVNDPELPVFELVKAQSQF